MGIAVDIQHQLIDALHSASDAAAAVTLAYFRTPDLSVENKGGAGFDPVTRADQEAEAAIRRVLRDLRPEDAILGEELDQEAGISGLCWVLDPIDGTRAFVSGAPTWGTLISLCDETGPILGMIDQPYIGERFWGGFGQAWLERGGQSLTIGTKGVSDLSDATLFTTFPEIGSLAERQAFERVASQVKLVRYGLDCYAYALLAAGHIDLIIEAGLHSYDIQAPIAVIEAAGGIVTNWQGGPAHGGGQAIAAANPHLHRAALALLAQEPGLV